MQQLREIRPKVEPVCYGWQALTDNTMRSIQSNPGQVLEKLILFIVISSSKMHIGNKENFRLLP
ncbi:hypothetical protein HA41_18780 [Pantoea conspicua]|uniref:Uncharacterized protein n=1 Tax=Pantoea conspicua TaxID=472705 RepID=A0A1X1BR90_9GAMM|nr:hypothetical protein HA41_18780 [Pantoea conspicua]